MKKILITLIILMFGLVAFAGEKEDALAFFNKFISASNNYSSELLTMYSDNAKIIRQVVKPDGKLVNVYFSVKDYKNQLKLNSKLAKIRNYKNYYSDISAKEVSSSYKISAKRKPSTSNYKLNIYVIIKKQQDGEWLITEEMMQTKEQIFLMYAKK